MIMSRLAVKTRCVTMHVRTTHRHGAESLATMMIATATIVPAVILKIETEIVTVIATATEIGIEIEIEIAARGNHHQGTTATGAVIVTMTDAVPIKTDPGTGEIETVIGTATEIETDHVHETKIGHGAQIDPEEIATVAHPRVTRKTGTT